MDSVIKKVNDGIYTVEKGIVVTSLLVMSVIVFFDVVYRRYTAVESKLAKVIGGAIGLEPDTAGWDTLMSASPWVTVIALFLIVFAAFLTASTRSLSPQRSAEGKDTRSERQDRRPSMVKAAAFAAASVGAAWLVLRVVFGNPGKDAVYCFENPSYSWECGMFPEGLIWSQSMALVLTAWVGFLGASMATSDNRQLKVEAALRYYPEGVKRVVGLVSGLLTAAFCVFLAWMSMKLILDLKNDYDGNPGLAGIFVGTKIPQYVGFSVLPIAYVLMALRFTGNGVLAFRGQLADAMGELGDMDLDAIGAELAASEGEGSEDGDEGEGGDADAPSEGAAAAKDGEGASKGGEG